jgi:hypothetical protein
MRFGSVFEPNQADARYVYRPGKKAGEEKIKIQCPLNRDLSLV